MSNIRNSIIRVGFDALYFSGAHHLLRPFLGGVGLILMLHHVRPPRDDAFQPNRHLEVTPDFLRATLSHIRAEGFEIIGLDEMHRRLKAGDFDRRFACFTFDDGYRDNRDHALPVMRAYDAPFTVYAAADFADGHGPLWWLALEQLIAQSDTIEAPIGDGLRLDCTTSEAKTEAFARLHGWLRELPNDTAVRDAIDRLCRQHGIQTQARGADLCMSWDELRAFAADPLVTIGAHTLSHCNLARESETGASREMADSRARIAEALQQPVRHFAYPYGDRSAATSREFALARTLGFETAVTTRPGVLFAGNAGHPTALPRISLNGNYQDRRFLAVLTSGAATAMWNGFRRVDAA